MDPSTQFVGTGDLPAVQSFHPCHIFGNPSLYGIAIRLSFYLLYITSILLILFSLPTHLHHLRPIRLAVSAIAIAVFINLCANSTGAHSLVVLDWWIGISYILFPSLFLLLPTRVLARFAVKKEKNEGGGRDVEEQAQPEEEATRSGSQHDYLGEDQQTQQQTQQQSSHHYFPGGEEPLSSPPQQQSSPDINIPEGQEPPLRGGEIPPTNTKEKTSFLKKVQDDAETHSHDLSHPLLLLVWILFVAATPWLYWIGMSHNQKDNCDVRVLFLVAPVSIYRKSFVNALKVFSVIGLLFCVVLLVLAVVLTIGILKRGRATQTQNGLDKTDMAGAAGGEAGAVSEKGAGSQAGGVVGGEGEAAPAQPTTPPPALSAEERAPQEQQDQSEQQQEEAQEEAKEEERKRKKNTLSHFIYAIFFLIALGLAIAQIEGTIGINNVDIDHKYAGSMGQMLGLVLAAGAVVKAVLGVIEDRRAENKELEKKEGEKEEKQGVKPEAGRGEGEGDRGQEAGQGEDVRGQESGDRRRDDEVSEEELSQIPEERTSRGSGGPLVPVDTSGGPPRI